MTTTRFALVTAPAAALLLTLTGVAGGCGGVTAALSGDGGTDGPASSGSGSGGTGSGSGGSSGASSSSNSGGVSSSSGTASSSSSGGTSGSSSGGSSSSSGTTSSSGVSSSSSSGGSSSGSDTGTLYFEQCSGSTLCQSPTFDFYAGFGAANGNAGCTVTTSGACSSYSCTGTAQNPVGDSAGTLTISGGSIGQGVTVTPDASNNYEYEASGSLFSAGQTLTVSASGATVPAFGPISVVAPALPVLTAPVAAGGTYSIPTTADLNVAWTGASPGGEIIFEGAANDSTSYFTCVWSSSLGQATVPQSMLTSLAGQTGGYVVFGQYAATSFSAGAYSISASALPYSGGTASFE